jgi:hypothetical protein
LRIVSATDSGLVDDLEALLPSWKRHLRAANLSPRTITAYLSTGQALSQFLRAAGRPAGASDIGREHIEILIEAQLARFRPSTAAGRDRLQLLNPIAPCSDHLFWVPP